MEEVPATEDTSTTIKHESQVEESSLDEPEQLKREAQGEILVASSTPGGEIETDMGWKVGVENPSEMGNENILGIGVERTGFTRINGEIAGENGSSKVENGEGENGVVENGVVENGEIENGDDENSKMELGEIDETGNDHEETLPPSDNSSAAEVIGESESLLDVEDIWKPKKVRGKYKCRHCTKSFTRKDAVLNHMKYHTGDAKKSHVCEICGKSFGFKVGDLSCYLSGDWLAMVPGVLWCPKLLPLPKKTTENNKHGYYLSETSVHALLASFLVINWVFLLCKSLEMACTQCNRSWEIDSRESGSNLF